MVQPQTYLNVADNTGAKKIMCIRILNKNKIQLAKVGMIIIAVVKESIPNMPIKKSTIVRAVIVRTTQKVQRFNGTSIRFDDNAAVLVNREGLPIGTRILGPVARELRDKNFTKIVSLAPEVL